MSRCERVPAIPADAAPRPPRGRARWGRGAGTQGLAAAGCLLVGAWLSMSAAGAQSPSTPPAGAADAGGLITIQVRENFYLIAGAGGNIGVQVGGDGVVVVDSGSAASADAVLAAIKRITPQPIRYVINTNGDADHVGGNEVLSKAGDTLFTDLGRRSMSGLSPDFIGGVASILSHEAVLARISAPTGGNAPFPTAAWPTETFYQPRKYLHFNGEGIEVLHQPAAHTNGDVFVFFRRSDVVAAGDVLDTTRFPVIDVAHGGSIDGEIAALNRLVDLAIPSVPLVSREEAGTLVLAGHGRLSDQNDVVEYRDMVTVIRDRVRDLMTAGHSLEQIQQTAPARGYERRYGSDTGSWTTKNFIEAIYRSLRPARS